jgi:hypothetical protein
MFGNIGGLISTWSFLPFDGPDYPIGNGLNLATSSLVLITSVALGIWMRASNGRKDSKAAEGSASEGLEQQDIEKVDWRHPDFRWLA